MSVRPTDPSFVESPPTGTLPPLGRQGEGWIALQTLLAIAVLLAGRVASEGWSGPWRSIAWAVGLVLMLAGVGLFAWGAATLGPSFSIWVAPRQGARLVEDGPYRTIRHPICTAQAIFGFGWALLWASPAALILAVAYAAYLDRFKLRREEETLLQRYEAYRAYQVRVRHRMVPLPRHSSDAAPGPIAHR